MSKSTRVHVASRTKHAAMWRDLRASGLNIVSSWIDQAESENLAILWELCIAEVKLAEALLFYIQGDEVLKGALVEVGVALANKIPVYVIGFTDQSWMHHPLVQRFASVQSAVTEILEKKS